MVHDAAEIDFEAGTYVVDSKETIILHLNNLPTVPINLENLLTPDSVHPIFTVLGIEFFQSVNGE